MIRLDSVIATLQTTGGAILAGTPWWAKWVSTINEGASAVASICGAIIGIYGVYKITHKFWKK